MKNSCRSALLLSGHTHRALKSRQLSKSFARKERHVIFGAPLSTNRWCYANILGACSKSGANTSTDAKSCCSFPRHASCFKPIKFRGRKWWKQNRLGHSLSVRVSFNPTCVHYINLTWGRFQTDKAPVSYSHIHKAKCFKSTPCFKVSIIEIDMYFESFKLEME